MSHKVFFLLMLLVFISCQRKMTKDEYMVMLNDKENGIVQTFEKGNVVIKAQYLPEEWMASQFLGENLTREKIDSIKRNITNNIYFSLKFSANGKDLLSNVATNKAQFGTLVNELAFGLNDNLFLITENRDTLELVDQHFSRYYGMADANHVLLIFNKENITIDQDLKLKLKDIGIRTGDMSFNFKQKDLKKANTIKLKTR